MVLDAIQRGVERPPLQPFTLAEMRGIKLLPTDRVVDARTYSDDGQHFAIEYNPQRAAQGCAIPSRMNSFTRYSGIVRKGSEIAQPIKK